MTLYSMYMVRLRAGSNGNEIMVKEKGRFTSFLISFHWSEDLGMFGSDFGRTKITKTLLL